MWMTSPSRLVRSDDLKSWDRRPLRGFELLDKLQRGFANQILSGQAPKFLVCMPGIPGVSMKNC
jgi:hypothetical protein